jgi:glycosyltransferase involved in cell wall biosynthesis
MPKLLRITTVPISLRILLQGQMNFMKENGWKVLAVSSKGEEVDEVMEKEGVEHVAIPLTRKISPLTDLLALWKLCKIIRKFNPVIIHSHTPKAGLIGMMAGWICRVPVRLHTVAGLPLMEYSGWKRILLNQTEKLTYHFATRVYPNSYQLFDFIRNNLFSNTKKFKIIGKGSSNGIDVDFFSPSKKLKEDSELVKSSLNIPTDGFVFLFVGRLVRDKGIVELVQAFEELNKLNNNTYLLLVGSLEQNLDPLPNEVLTKIKSHHKIILTGFQKDVRPYFAASDVFVFPSYREGFPNVVLQAACMELPIIASNINGCNEIIEHEVSGLLVPAKSVKELEDAMRLLLNESSKREMYRKKAASFVRDNFERTHFWNLLLTEYNMQIQDNV